MERSVSSGSLHIQKFQDILLADSYMCLPSDFPRPSNHMIAAIQSDKKGGSEKPFRESTWRKNLTGYDTPKKDIVSIQLCSAKIHCRLCQMATCLTRLDQRLHNIEVIGRGGPSPPWPKSVGVVRAGSVCR